MDVLSPEQSQLGKKSAYEAAYNPKLLFPIPRQGKRDEIGINGSLPFVGFDLWHHYEVSWLDLKGKPVVAIARLAYSCETPCIVESKSMKLYFNSLNNTRFEHAEKVRQTLQRDLENAVQGSVRIELIPLNEWESDEQLLGGFDGLCLDGLPVACSEYLVNPHFLKANGPWVDEVLHSNLLKSNCLVTLQPDWGSVQIAYKGPQIDHEGLLKYIVSFRNHNEFHEQCVERIFVDILERCCPEELTVFACYTRRGGLDINPYRSTHLSEMDWRPMRLCRQ